ncbi:type II and III secretion system protein family protein [Maritalea porphyrae]|uniref:type II and III secretion system protein family protein n=1 Tax=Maritalea porphyrae TaxID=880732 RepID=UPI0022B04EC2|nr:type II and III secretion system protein family protein [Maritalea porphyrae]MCZ4272052.1 type II and III secretion system protein family protein [Maritalea porphyrae]
MKMSRYLAQCHLKVLCAVLTAIFCSVATSSVAQTVNYDLSTTSVLRINLPVSQAITVVVSEPVTKIVSANPLIAEAQPITDKSLYLVAKSFGTTTVNLFSEDGTPVGLLAVEISADVGDMSRSIRAAIPNSDVKIHTINGRIRLSGSVVDEYSMQKVLEIVDQYGSPAVINTMTISGGRQVNLEVRILEAQRDAGRQLGVQWGGSVGGVTATIGSSSADSPSSGAKSFSSFVATVLSGATGTSLNATINALETKRLVRTLAEPNLTTLSGIKASFLAGGQVPIRVRASDGSTTLEYRDFGVRLVFTPVVLDGGRIQIHLTPEVSNIGSFTTAGDPIFNTRTLDATVELRDGQSFSVAGLLQNNTNLSQDQLPWISDVPVIGSLFKSSGYKKHDTELVVIVTPRLVQPTVPGQILASPLDASLPANDFEFFALGKLEVTPKMIKGFRAGAGVVGAYGYDIDLGEESGQ